MEPTDQPAEPSPAAPPPRAFSQGVGLVFQTVGVTLFVATMLVCCGSGLLSRDWATSAEWGQAGWNAGAEGPVYSVQRAVSVSVVTAVFLGVALASIGLGLQGESARAAVFAVIVTAIGLGFWVVHSVFAVQNTGSTLLIAIATVLAAIFAGLFGFALAALREMRRSPPPPGHEILPADYKVPYSHLHQDPPEVRLERELAQRRERLAVQQKELELLEEKLRRKMDERPPTPDS